MIDYFSEKFFDRLIKVAKQVDDENQENFKKLEDELKTAQTQYEKVVEQNKCLQKQVNYLKNYVLRHYFFIALIEIDCKTASGDI